MKQQGMNVLAALAMVILGLGLPACSTAPVSQAKKEEQRTEVRDTANEVLRLWYAKHPGAEQSVKKSAGYAVFSDAGYKVLFMGGAKGAGIAVNNSDKRTYYMKMLELQPGLGLGAEKFHVIFLFATSQAFHDFVTHGWEAGASAMSLAKTSSMNRGGAVAVSVMPGVTMHQLNDKGVIVGVGITGAKFYKDSELN